MAQGTDPNDSKYLAAHLVTVENLYLDSDDRDDTKCGWTDCYKARVDRTFVAACPDAEKALDEVTARLEVEGFTAIGDPDGRYYEGTKEAAVSSSKVRVTVTVYRRYREPLHSTAPGAPTTSASSESLCSLGIVDWVP